jgi:cobalt/nickel transport system permease protein
MNVDTFDRYQQRDSFVHRLDPRVKVVVTLLFIVSNVLLPDGAWFAFLASWGIILLVGQLAHLAPGYVFKRSFIAIPFALAAITVLFTVPGETLATWQVGTRTFQISQPGLIRFASILVRSWLSVQMAILLTAVTRFPDLMHALRHLRFPRILIAIISFMYRYLFVLVDEASRLLRARQARSARPCGRKGGGGSLTWRAKVAGNMVGQLFLRSIERSDRVYNAMLARGYQGRLLTMTPHMMRKRDWLSGAIAMLLIGSIQIAARLF